MTDRERERERKREKEREKVIDGTFECADCIVCID